MAAVQGLPQAQLNLGILFETGEGVSQDKAEAISWYRMAAEKGNKEAQAALTRLTGEQTSGVPKP